MVPLGVVRNVGGGAQPLRQTDSRQVLLVTTGLVDLGDGVRIPCPQQQGKVKGKQIELKESKGNLKKIMRESILRHSG